jgi:glucan phosphoethanolaminetransferase (alkaline phosphatase superfamily)
MNEIQLTGVCLLIVVSVAITLMIVFRNTLFVRKYWRYAAILLPFIILIGIKLLSSKTKQTNNSKKDDLSSSISNIKDQLHEANQVAAIEVSAAKEKNKEKLDQLKEATKISDSSERRKRLSELMG